MALALRAEEIVQRVRAQGFLVDGPLLAARRASNRGRNHAVFGTDLDGNARASAVRALIRVTLRDRPSLTLQFHLIFRIDS